MPRAKGHRASDDGPSGSQHRRAEFAQAQIDPVRRPAGHDLGEDTLEVRHGGEDEAEAVWRRFDADLRSALAAIRSGFADKLSEPGLDRKALEAAVRRAREETAGLEKLVRDLSLLARLDQDSPLETEETDVSALVHDLVADARVAAPTRTITLSADERAIAVVDADIFARAITNLLANASQHTPNETTIEVAVRNVDGEVMVEVVDHGPGFDPGVRDQLVERFASRVASRSATDGWGLSLVVTATVAVAHGGRCDVRPTNGGGATFVVTIPARQETTRPAS